jgi:hypothetical protein
MAYTTINKGSSYFNTVLYTGNGTSQSITGVGFQPDWVWIKSRSNAEPHMWTDVVRGTDKNLRSNTTDSEFTDANNITSFNSNGFSLGSGGAVNENAYTFASWNWLGGGTGVSNTSGTISSTVSANTTSGFSIVSYTGTGANATVGHGLGVAPKMVIVKGRSTTYDWIVWQTPFAGTDYIVLNKTDAKGTVAAVWNSTIPTSTVFSLGSNLAVNQSSATQIAYCFAEVKGYSKFGSYTGNGSTNGTFIYTGFKPAFIMHKRTDSTGEWFIFDSKRIGYNAENYRLIANTTDSEADPGEYDILSNGVKIRFTSGNVNASGGTYIYMAFAENPFVSSTLIPTTARYTND